MYRSSKATNRRGGGRPFLFVYNRKANTHPEHTAINEQIDRERQRGKTATQEVMAGDSSVTADRIKAQYLTLTKEQPSNDADARS